MKDWQKQETQLLENIVNNLEGIEKCLNLFNNLRGYEDLVYRFYHQSIQVFQAQNFINSGYEKLKSLNPKKEKKLDEYYEEIVHEAMSKEFSLETNKIWTRETRPIIEAFLHTRYFIEQARHYGLELEKEKIPLRKPFGWAALLTLYKIW
jgi:hypothetical protein